MKALKHLAAACAVLVLLTSCSALTRTATKLASATTIGNSTGSALSSIFSVLKSAGVIDLSNLVQPDQQRQRVRCHQRAEKARRHRQRTAAASGLFREYRHSDAAVCTDTRRVGNPFNPDQHL